MLYIVLSLVQLLFNFAAFACCMLNIYPPMTLVKLFACCGRLATYSADIDGRYDCRLWSHCNYHLATGEMPAFAELNQQSAVSENVFRMPVVTGHLKPALRLDLNPFV